MGYCAGSGKRECSYCRCLKQWMCLIGKKQFFGQWINGGEGATVRPAVVVRGRNINGDAMAVSGDKAG